MLVVSRRVSSGFQLPAPSSVSLRSAFFRSLHESTSGVPVPNGWGKIALMTTTITYLNGADIDRLALGDADILDAVAGGLHAQGEHRVVLEPRVHLEPDPAFSGHFNILRGYIAPLELAGVKVVGDYVNNYRHGLPSEMALLSLFDPTTGRPVAIMDATAITEMRTGALTAIGGRYLARQNSRVLGHIGARGTAYWNVRLLDHLFDLTEIRVHSRRPASRDAFARRLTEDLGKRVIATSDWESCVREADIVVEASRLDRPQVLLKTAWIKPGAFVVPYGTMSAVELSLTDIMDKIIVDDWGQCRVGKLGSLRPHVNAGKLTEDTLYAELADIVVGAKPGRQAPEETILLWHRGLALSDIALGERVLTRAREHGIGIELPYR